MDLSMILNTGDDDGYASPPPSSPRSPVQVSTRWSVDEMRSAVAILSDLPQPDTRARAASDDDEDDEDDDEQEDTPQRRAPVMSAPCEQGFSGLDLLFQADAMIQKRVSPEMRATKAAVKTKSKRSKAVVVDEDDNDDGMEASPKYMRSGVWTRAEEEYAAALIFYFLRGALPIAEGTTLRKYLAEQLCCNRRRVSMKLATETIADKKIPRKVGASVFVSLKPAPSDADRREVADVLEKLRRECFREVEAQTSKTPRQDAASSSGIVSPLVLGAKEPKNGSSPSALSLSTPSRRKSPKKQRRPSNASSINSTPKASPSQIRRRRPLIIRTGFDSEIEEQYATALVEYFMEGTLDVAEDTRLVSYLCEQLDVSPKTLSMKLAPRRSGEQKFPENIGTITFTRREDDDASSEIFEAEAHVFELRQNWLQSREEETDDVDDDEEKQSVSSSPALTPSRKTRAEASTSTSTTKSPPSGPRSYSRSGPWSRHEEEYAAGLIDCFFRGVLDIPEGTTLRAFLTSRLNCNPMRISKKLASHTIADVKIPKKLGSATYVRRDGISDEERRLADEHLRHLEHVSQSEQNLKEDIVIGVIGSKHGRDDVEAPHEYGRHHHRVIFDDAHMEPVPSSSSVVSPSSPFKMRRVLVEDEYATSSAHHHHSDHSVRQYHHHNRSPVATSPYDHHHDAAMRYQRVAY